MKQEFSLELYELNKKYKAIPIQIIAKLYTKTRSLPPQINLLKKNNFGRPQYIAYPYIAQKQVGINVFII